MRIIFVGMHNKGRLLPLDSSTKSGKLIDCVIKRLPDFEVLKSNLWGLDHYPRSTHFNYKLCDRVGYTSDDIIVALGAYVQDAFRRSPFKFVRMGHPSAVWSHEKQKDYVERALANINLEVLKKALTK